MVGTLCSKETEVNIREGEVEVLVMYTEVWDSHPEEYQGGN